MSIAIQLVFNILISTMLFGLVAAGFSLIYGVTKILHLAQGAVVLFAGYMMFWMGKAGLPLWLTIILALLLSVILGILLNFFVYERLRRQRRVSVAGSLIASTALLLLLQAILLAFFKSKTQIISLGIKTLPPLEIFGATITVWQILIIGIAALSILALIIFIKKSRVGTALRAVSDNEEVAEIVGIDSKKMRYLAFAIGSFMAGIAGILTAVELNLEPNMAMANAVKAFGRAVVGGVGSIPGAVLGSLLVETGEHLGAWFWTSSFKEVISFVLVFAFLIWRPQGILGRKL